MDKRKKNPALFFDQTKSLLIKRELLFEKIALVKENNEPFIKKWEEILRKLDRLLDRITDDPKELLSLLASPASLKKIEEAEEIIKQIESFLSLLLPICTQCSQIKTLLFQKQKFLFTRHPKVKLAFAWQDLLEMIEEKAVKLEVTLPLELQLQQNECIQILENLKKEIKKRWNSKIYSSYPPYLERIEEITRSCQTSLSFFQKKQREMLKEIEEILRS